MDSIWNLLQESKHLTFVAIFEEIFDVVTFLWIIRDEG